ncbi:MAG: Ig-like domain repeat protein [Terracidiphilus sp.]
MLLFSSACLVSGIGAQSAGSAVAGSSLGSSAPSTFLVAPSFPLGYAPSSVATGDLTRSGKLDLITADYSSGEITVFLAAGKGNFAPGVAYAAGAHPSSVAVADINGDGRPGVVVTNESAGTISVLLGNGDGTLQPLRRYAIGFNPSFIATGDFSGNGRVDVAVAGKSGQLAILLNDGNGSLKAPIVYPLSKTPTALAMGDFNNDGHNDLALANADGTVSILLGKGAGLFRALPDTSVASGPLSSLASADLNKDGRIDLVVTQPGQKLVSVLLGKGDGTFAPPASYPVGNEPVSTVVADVDGDGVADLAVINKASNTFSVLGGNGDGTFKSSLDFVAGNAPLAAVAGDFYGDGHADLAIINHTSQTVSVPAGNGDRTFKAGRSYEAGVQPVSIASGNLHGDKIPGLVVANYCGSDPTCSKGGSIAVFLADEKGMYQLSSTYAVGAGPVSVALADVNGDRNLDIVALNRLDKTATVMLGVGDGTFRQPMTFPLAGAPIAVAVGDLNKDGKPDLAVLEDCGSAKCSQAGSLEILLGGGDGSFQSAASYPVGYSPASIAVGAIHGDKNLDLVVANRCGKDASCQSAGTATVLIGDGTGKFTPGTDIALGNSPASIALGNLTGSGLDLVVSRSTDNTVAVLHGNGDGTFRAAVPYPVGNNPGSLVVADFNGDGKADVAVANVNDATVSILYGRGDGTLQAASALAVGSSPTALTVIGSTTGGHPSLATADGASSSGVGTEFKVLPHGTGTTPLTSFTLTSGTNPSSVNEPVLLTATLVGAAGTPPGENVTFNSNGTSIPDCTTITIAYIQVTATGTTTATCTTSSLPIHTGGDSLTAEFGGDSTYLNGTSSPVVTQTVNAFAATISVGTTPTAVNQPVTITAQLSGTGIAFTPTPPNGTFNFMASIGGAPAATITGCGAVPVTATGGASCPWTPPAGTAATTYPISVTYTGDTNFTTAAAGTATQTFTAFAATISVGTTPTAVNQPVTITAQLAGTGIAFTPTAPSGTFNFMASIGGAPLATISGCGAVPVTATGSGAGGASCPWTPPAGTAATTYPISVTYSGDTNFTTAAAGTATQTFIPFAATINVGTTPTAVNQPVTITAQLAGTGIAFTPTAPSGTFNFTAGGTTIATCGAVSVNATGGASCTTSSLVATAAKTYAISVTYSGDSNFTAAAPGTATQTFIPFAATINVSSPGAGTVNSPVTLSAQLAGTGIAFTPTPPAGKFNFGVTVAGTTTSIPTCGAVSVNASGGASCQTSALVAPSDAISVTYSGDSNFTVATNGAMTQAMSAAAATLSLTSPGASTVNSPVTFTATLGGATFTPVLPSGNVAFSATIGGKNTTLCSSVAVSLVTGNWQATCKTSVLVAPSDGITASYSGDNNFTVAAAATMTQTVNAVAATLSLTSPGASNVDASVTFTATLGGATFTPVLPSGNVAFTATIGTTSTTLCGSVAVALVSGNWQATCSTNALIGPSDAIKAVYSGDNNFTVATAATMTQTVNPLSTTTTITAAPSSSVNVGTTVTFTATVGASSVSPVAPSGTVTFLINGATSADCPSPVTVNGSQQATCTTASLIYPNDRIDATYNANNSSDPSFTTSTTTFYETVNKGSGVAVTTLTSIPTSPDVNQTATLTATVTASSGSVVPTGTVTFMQGGTTLCSAVALTVNKTNATAVCNYAFTAAVTGSTLTANYSGDTNFGAGSGTLKESVNASPTATTLSSTPSSSTVNQQVAFTATVTPTFIGTAKPTGTVTFVDNSTSTTLCLKLPLSNGIAVCNYPFLSTGSNSVVATYTSGDTNFTSGSPSAADVQIVSKTATTTTVVSSLPSAAVDQPVTFTATITPAIPPFTGSTPPTGTVGFTYTPSGGSASPLSCTPAQPISVSTASGVTTAACTASLPANGNYTITATYSGDANFTSPAPGTVIQPVGLAKTTTALVATPSTSTVNQSVTFTATVTPSTSGSTNPTGTVTFSYTNSTVTTPVNLCAPVTVSTSSGTTTAKCSAPFLVATTDQVVATYSGDTNFASSATVTPTQVTVSSTATTTAVAGLPSPSTVNQAVTFTATITPGVTPFAGSTNPSGTVAFSWVLNGGTPVTLCAAASVSTTTEVTTATCTAPLPTAGSYTVTAAYSGDSNFAKSTNTVGQTVNQTATMTAVAGLPSPSSVNQAVTFTATVTPSITGSTNPTGSVAFSYTFNGGSPVTLCASSPLSTSGTTTTATCNAASTVFGSKGTYTITAAYSGDSNFKAGSGSAPQDVGVTPTTTSVVAAPSSPIVGQAVTFTATVLPSIPGSTNPTGTVAFSYVLSGGSPVTLCPSAGVTPSTGVSTCTDPLPSAGFYTVTAAYSGDSNFGPSSSNAILTVNPATLTLTLASSPAPSLVNQLVTFTATLGLPHSGTAPTSTVTFKDTSTGLILCSNEPVSGSNVTFTATCSYTPTPQWTAGSHAITATYNPGDPNFPTITTIPPLSQVVQPTPTTATLTSSLSPSVATQTVTFTATVIPGQIGAVLPSGNFAFTSNGASSSAWIPAASCSAAPVAPITSGAGAGTATATCTATFPAGAGDQAITAVYLNDPNFTTNSNSATFAQTVQNFSIANSVTSTLNPTATTGPVTLTQGYSTATSSAAGTDPFNPTKVQLGVTSTDGFTDLLNLTCVVTNAANQAIVKDPSCTVSKTAHGATGTSLIYTLSASDTAPVGEYTATLTATDSPNPALSRQAILTVYVVGVAGALSQVPGASATENVLFNTAAAPASTTLVSFTCGTVLDVTTGKQIASSLISCTGPTAGVTVGNVAADPNETSVPITIAVSTATAQLERSSTIYAGLFLGMPLVALMGWIGSRKSPRKNFFRFIGLILMIAIASYAATGCGGSFTKPPPITTTYAVQPGYYLVQVIATDKNGNQYYAVVPLTVNNPNGN